MISNVFTLKRKRIVIISLVGLLFAFIIYQNRLLLANGVWTLMGVEDYKISVHTIERLGSDQTLLHECKYTITVQNNTVSDSFVDCQGEDTSATFLASYQSEYLTVDGLFQEAKKFQQSTSSNSSGYKKFSTSFYFPYFFPKTIDFLIDEDGVYSISLFVESFEILDSLEST